MSEKGKNTHNKSDYIIYHILLIIMLLNLGVVYIPPYQNVYYEGQCYKND